ncbi:MAG: hypothetical protein ACR2NI_00355 [Pirellulales bacterium]
MSYANKIKGNDIRTQTLPPNRAKKLVQNCNERHTRILVIRLLPELGKDTLLELVNFNGELHLPDVQILEPLSQRGPIQTNLKSINLDSISTIDPLKHHFYLSLKTGISLSGLKTLTPEVAQIIKERSFPTTLNGITHINDSVAEMLVDTPGILHLDNLEQQNCPPMLQARFLSRELKEHCNLINELSSEPARSLKENLTSDTLSLNHIKNLTANTAKEITGKHSLELNGISELDRELAEVLGNHEGSLLLDKVTDVTSPELQALTKKPTKLSLRSLKSLPLGGLKNLETRTNVTLSLFSLKRLSEAKASRLARLPIHIVLDCGSSLTANTVEILARGTARFTIKDPDSVDPSVIQKISDLDATNIKIDTSTELQAKINKLREGVASRETLELTRQNTFTKDDLKSVRQSKKQLRLVFQEQVLFDDVTAGLISECMADFVFLKTGQLRDQVLMLLLAHPGKMILGSFRTSEEQCRTICQKKKCGQIEIPSFLNFDISKGQINELKKNRRVDVS